DARRGQGRLRAVQPGGAGPGRRAAGRWPGARRLRRCATLPAAAPAGLVPRRSGLMSQGSLPILQLVLDASWVVQCVLVLRGMASLTSWPISLGTRALLARARGEADHFETTFWSGGDLGTLYRNLEAKGGSHGMSSIFEMGFREFARLRQSGATADQQLEG